MENLFPIYLIRMNLKDDLKIIENLFHNDEVAVLINQRDEIDYWNFINEEKYFETKPRPVQFVHRWKKLQNLSRETDILVIAKYLDKNYLKIGILKKDTIFSTTNSGLISAKLLNCKSFKSTKYPILNSIIPHQVTLSPVKQKRELIHHIYFEDPLYKPEFSIENISPNLIELVCLEWLRADFKSKIDKPKLKYQLLNLGGNYADVDIFGMTDSGKKIACQISSTIDLKLINKKIDKLKNFEGDNKILFTKKSDSYIDGIRNISIYDIWNDLLRHPDYEKFLQYLVEN